MNNNEGNLWLFTKKIIVRLSLVGLLIFIPILIFGKSLFGIVFGETWKTAGVFAQLLVPWLFMKFVLSPITSIPIIKGKQKQFFLISLFYNIAFPLIIILMSKCTVNFNYILLVCSLFMFLIFGAIIFWFRHLLKISGD